MARAEVFLELFGSRTDQYAEGYPHPRKAHKYAYVKRPQALTPALLERHFTGDVCVAVYPLVDNRVKWFAVDLDAPKDKDQLPIPGSFDGVWDLARQQQEAFGAAGLTTYIERSRSGTGCHVWGFLEDWLPADMVRETLTPLVVLSRTHPSMDLLYPVQTAVEGEDSGSNLTLPYYGKGASTFMQPYTKEPIALDDFLATVAKNKSAVFRKIREQQEGRTRFKLADTLGNPRSSRPASGGFEPPAEGRETRMGALKLISPYGCRFMRHCWENRRTLLEPEWDVAISQCTAFEYGRQFAHALSRDYPNYSEAETDERYSRKLENPIYSCQYIKDTWPELACEGCTCKAPYQLADKSLIELVEEGTSIMEMLGDFQDDIAMIQALNTGDVPSGISCGIPGLDTVTRFRPSELTVIGGLPSIGKTWFMVDMAASIAAQGTMTLLYSGETSRRPLRQRFLARKAEIDLERLRGEHPMKLTSSELSKIRAAGTALATLPIYTDFGTLSPSGILTQVERTLLGGKYPLTTPYVILYDYLQFASGNEDQDRVTQIGSLVREFKYLAKLLEAPVAVFSQLKRFREEKLDERPSMTDFADSSSIERTMDTGIMLSGERAEGPYAGRWIDIVKQREGRSNMRLHYVLHQGYGKWDFSDSRQVPTELTSLLDD